MDGDGLAAAREAYAASDWAAAVAALAGLDDGELGPEDLERLAVAARLTGDPAASDDAWTRAHRAWLAAEEPAQAARAAWWLAMALLSEGDGAQASGWFARATSTLDAHGLDTVERGFLLVPESLMALFSGDAAGALQVLEQVDRYARRDGDPDLRALACLGRGQALVALGRLGEGVGLLDEAMVSVTAGEVSPVLAGIVYCAVIEACLEICDVARAEEWTDALTRWCEAQPGLVPFRGQCLVDRAELLHVRGDWDGATARVLEAHELFARSGHPAIGRAWYVRGEQSRDRGDLDAAEDAYRQAARRGHDPHPGLALLWLARGELDKALSASRRLVDDVEGARDTVGVLSAHVRIALAAGDVAQARAAADRLEELSTRLDTPMLRAVAAVAQGDVLLAEGDAASGARVARLGLAAWREVGAPLEEARARVLIGRACRALGDLDTAELEWEIARDVLRRLGARPELAALDALDAAASPGASVAAGGLTGRELEVLEQLAAGKTNREIAAALVISEKTVSRHLSNIFTKLDVGTRAAATAWAFRHGLV